LHPPGSKTPGVRVARTLAPWHDPWGRSADYSYTPTILAVKGCGRGRVLVNSHWSAGEVRSGVLCHEQRRSEPPLGGFAPSKQAQEEHSQRAALVHTCICRRCQLRVIRYRSLHDEDRSMSAMPRKRRRAVKMSPVAMGQSETCRRRRRSDGTLPVGPYKRTIVVKPAAPRSCRPRR